MNLTSDMIKISKTNIQRVTVKKRSANPLFEKWLTEWRDQAKENNSKMQFTFNSALKTLKKYPLQLDSGKDCLILKGFGSTLCNMLDKKLSEYKTNNGSNVEQGLSINKSPTVKRNTAKAKNSKSPKPGKSYLPAKRSGGYAILVTLMKRSQELNYTGSLTKHEIMEYGHQLCDKSFTKPDPGSYYTAWSSMSTLISKGLVLRKGSPPKFSLTDEGECVALKLIENDDSAAPENDINTYIARSNILNTSCERENDFAAPENDINTCITRSNSLNTSCEKENVNLEENNVKILNCDKLSTQSASNRKKIIANNIELKDSLPRTTNSKKSDSQNLAVTSVNNNDTEDIISSQTSHNVETIIFAPRTFDVILLVDTQETTGSRNPVDDETISELQRLKVNFEVRHLKVGDFTWICRERNTKQELVLPYIVERKRMDDLGHSIKDGRFHEQKFRLKQCGIKNLMYIVESYGNNSRTVLPLPSLMQGAVNTLIQDQFQVKFTENQRHSMQYLSGFTLMLKHIYQEKTIMSCPKESVTPSNITEDLISCMAFEEFNKGASKTKKFKVRDIFVRQLLQLKGMSVEKALAIVEKYSTPKLLKMEYDRIGYQGEKLLSSISYGPLKKAIGPVISRSVFQLYTIDKLL